jgi:integrase
VTAQQPVGTADPTPTAPAAPTATRPKRRSGRNSFGSIRKLPSGRYQARYSDDQMNRHTAPQTFASRRAAEDWLATVRADQVRGTWLAPQLGTVTLADYIADHLATRLDLAPKTRQVYAAILAGWIDQPLVMPPVDGRRARTVHLGQVELGTLSVATIREWHAAALHTAGLRAQERLERRRAREIRDATVHAARTWARSQQISVPDTGRLPAGLLKAWRAAGSPPAPIPEHLRDAAASPPSTVGRAAVAQAYRFLRTMCGHAVREGRILANPCELSGAGVVRAATRVPATPQEIAALADAMPERYAAAVHLAAWSGLRAGELFGLARRHLDLTAGTVRVERAAVTCLNGSAPSLGPTKTDSSRRTVHLPPHLLPILTDHLERFTGSGPEALIFTTAANQIVPREARQAAFDRARRAVGRPDLRWHDLRHTGATLAAHAGASLSELMHRMGHSTVRAAMVYQHTDQDRDRDLARRLSLLANPPEHNETALDTGLSSVAR